MTFKLLITLNFNSGLLVKLFLFWEIKLNSVSINIFRSSSFLDINSRMGQNLELNKREKGNKEQER